MEELIRTNDPVLISRIVALLEEAGLDHLLLDQHMSVLEGSLGILQKRILVPSGDIATARQLVREIGLGNELSGESSA